MWLPLFRFPFPKPRAILRYALFDTHHNAPMIQISILYSGDIHANVDRLLRLAYLAKQQRQELSAVGRHVVLVDAGDAEDARSVESEVTKGTAIYRLLRMMGYDAAVVGNGLLLSYGPGMLAHLQAMSNLPLLCANLFTRDLHPTPVPGTLPTRIIPCGPIRMGLIGLTTEIKETYERFYGVRQPNTFEIAQKQLNALRTQGCQIIGALSHLGYERDVELAETVPDLSFIIGGHSHARLVVPRVIYGVPICHAGDCARYLGRLDLVLDEHGKLQEWSSQLLPVRPELPADQEASATWTLIQQDVERKLGLQIGKLTAPADRADDHLSAAGQLVAEALRERANADVGLCASGHLRAGLPQGCITLRDLVAACRSPVNPGVADVSGAQLVRALEYGADPDVWHRRPRSMLGSLIGVLQASGLRYDVHPAAPYGERVSNVLIGGQPVDPAATYRVAGTDFELRPRRGYFPDLQAEDIRLDVSRVLREVLQDYLHRHSPVTPPGISPDADAAVTPAQAAAKNAGGEAPPAPGAAPHGGEPHEASEANAHPTPHPSPTRPLDDITDRLLSSD